VASGVKCGAHGGKKKQDEVMDRSRCGVAAHDRSLHTGFAVIHQKTARATWLNHKTKTGGSAGCTKKLRCRRTRGGIAGLASGGRGLRKRRGRVMKKSAI
jgi:hypothetical protein